MTVVLKSFWQKARSKATIDDGCKAADSSEAKILAKVFVSDWKQQHWHVARV
jgi:hypothetical protein